MKKILILSALISLLLTGCAEKTITDVKPSAILNQFEQDETFIVYFGLSYCSACKIFRSVIESSMKTEEFDVLYLEYDKLMEDAGSAADLENIIANYIDPYSPFLYSFPILYIVDKGEIIDSFALLQTDTEAEFIARLKLNGVISE